MGGRGTQTSTVTSCSTGQVRKTGSFLSRVPLHCGENYWRGDRSRQVVEGCGHSGLTRVMWSLPNNRYYKIDSWSYKRQSSELEAILMNILQVWYFNMIYMIAMSKVLALLMI